MKIKIISVGKVKETYYCKGINEKIERIKKLFPIEIIELKDEKTPDKASTVLMDQIKAKEGSRILDRINEQDYVIALCIEGQQLSSRQLQKMIYHCKNQGQETVVFVIGGSLGLDKKVVQRANFKLSFSALTFPHQMMRLILLEQIDGVLQG